MTEVIKKENKIDMPDNSDMIAEAMKEVSHITYRQNMQLITSKSSILCPNTSRKSSTKNTELIGIVLLAKILAHSLAMKPKTTFSFMKVSLPSYSTKLDDSQITSLLPILS